ncbi:MAG: hypothetical protein KCHDKBKB_02402 [Elusimicrobia bacterium]|nr:hypothetical protein [Elusimicrobiota bacterium]
MNGLVQSDFAGLGFVRARLHHHAQIGTIQLNMIWNQAFICEI